MKRTRWSGTDVLDMFSTNYAVGAGARAGREPGIHQALTLYILHQGFQQTGFRNPVISFSHSRIQITPCAQSDTKFTSPPLRLVMAEDVLESLNRLQNWQVFQPSEEWGIFGVPKQLL
jgi:hypothetical protein